MAKVLEIEDIMSPDQVALTIAEQYLSWETSRSLKVSEWEEIQRYVFATDTSKTGNSKLPWSNKTTIPKLCQIRDNLHANYMAALFPQRKWITWEGSSRADETAQKRKAIESYMGWSVDRNDFYDEIAKLVYDYIDYGNCFSTVEWVDKTQTLGSGNQKYGYVGTVPRRIAPTDIVFDPTATSFEDSPKIVRSYLSLGEVKDTLLSPTLSEEDRKYYTELITYLEQIRERVATFDGQTTVKNAIYSVAGFGSWQEYLCSDTVEILTFYGNIYNEESGKLERNRIVKIVDRHKLISNVENPSFFGKSVIFHSGWRVRPDNLWAMGPLDNLVGMQYRIDHLENMKADVFDLIAYPVLKIKGNVEDFTWGPFERILVGDDGDVSVVSPPHQTLLADNQIEKLEAKMEEMAGSPREAMGFRTPGEKTMYEVQRLELAAGRMFISKISQFERQQIEEILNAMLELARRKMTPQVIRVFDSEFDIAVFKDLSPEDITGSGRLRPVAARHFAEKATMVQNLTSFFNSAAGRDPLMMNHFSSIAMAKLWENLLGLEQYGVITENIRVSETAEAQKLQQSAQEEVMMNSQTAAGFVEGDSDPII